jgi:hypothetical protein
MAPMPCSLLDVAEAGRRRGRSPPPTTRPATRRRCESRTIGMELAVAVRGIPVGEAALDARVALVGAAVLPRDHPHDPGVVAGRPAPRPEGAADPAVGAGGDDRAGRHPELDDGLLGERVGRAGLDAGAAGDAFGGKEIRAAGGDAGVEAPPGDGEREGALDLAAGAHAAEQTMQAGVVGEIGVGRRPRCRRGGSRRQAVADLRDTGLHGERLDLAVAAGAAGAVLRVVGEVELHDPVPQRAGCRCRSRTTMPSVHGVVHEAGVPLAPSTSTRHSRQDPKAARLSVAHSLGMSMPAPRAARSTEVPSGTVTARPSMVSVTSWSLATAGVPRSGSG